MIYEDITVDGFKEYKQLTEKDIEEENTSLWHHSNIAHRFRMIVAVAIAGFNQLSGGAALAYYVSSSHFFPSQNPDQQSLAILILINLLQLVVTVVAGQMIERYGRRAFMQEGQKIIIITLFMIGFLIIVAPEHKELILMLVFIHMVGFSLSYGPCTFLIGTEIVNDIFYPALTQWVLITFNLTVVGYLVDLFGLGALCLFYCLTQILSFVFL
jgi:MFS family permease